MLKHEDNENYVGHHENFTCKLCSKIFITKDDLLNHEESVQAENVKLVEHNENYVGHARAVHE